MWPLRLHERSTLPPAPYSTTRLRVCPVFGLGSPLGPSPLPQPTNTRPPSTAMSSAAVVVAFGRAANLVSLKPAERLAPVAEAGVELLGAATAEPAATALSAAAAASSDMSLAAIGRTASLRTPGARDVTRA